VPGRFVISVRSVISSNRRRWLARWRVRQPSGLTSIGCVLFPFDSRLPPRKQGCYEALTLSPEYPLGPQTRSLPCGYHE
jgi:hypothetical protein